MVGEIHLPILIFIIGTALALATIAVMVISGRLTLRDAFARREWIAAAKIAAIFVMVILAIYVHTTERYISIDFIYGHF